MFSLKLLRREKNLFRVLWESKHGIKVDENRPNDHNIYMASSSRNVSKNKKSGIQILEPAEPVYSEEVDKWRTCNGNASLLDAFYAVVRSLNSDESRIRPPSRRKYDYRLKLYHEHFGKKIAIFYRYINTKLHLEYVLRHYNDDNRWKL